MTACAARRYRWYALADGVTMPPCCDLRRVRATQSIQSDVIGFRITTLITPLEEEK